MDVALVCLAITGGIIVLTVVLMCIVAAVQLPRHRAAAADAGRFTRRVSNSDYYVSETTPVCVNGYEWHMEQDALMRRF